MKIAVITSRFPYPLEKGDKLRLYFQLKELAKNNSIYLHALVDDEVTKANYEKLNSICESIQVYRISKGKRYFSLAKNIIGSAPFQNAYFHDKSLKEQVKQNLENEKPDIVYAQLIRTAEYVKDVSFPKAIDLMDAFSESMMRESLKAKNPLVKGFFNAESKRIAKYETELSSQFEVKTIISEQDRDIIGDRVSDLEVIRNGVDSEYFKNESSYPRYDIAFVGNMGYRPNVSAASYLNEQILPLLREANPLVSIIIAGARPTKKVQSMNSANVTIMGWMDDIREAYASAKIFVAPIFSGAGQQNKILEAMAMGVPCVTTSLVNNGIRATPGLEIEVADTPEEFCQSVDRLLKDEEYYQQIKNSARNFVVNNYSWEKNAQKLELLLKNAVK